MIADRCAGESSGHAADSLSSQCSTSAMLVHTRTFSAVRSPSLRTTPFYIHHPKNRDLITSEQEPGADGVHTPDNRLPAVEHVPGMRRIAAVSVRHRRPACCLMIVAGWSRPLAAYP